MDGVPEVSESNMWKWLHPYAKPETAYHLSGNSYLGFSVLAPRMLTGGTVWGLAFAPSDYQQGDSFRIIYIHVPSAIWSMGVYDGHCRYRLGLASTPVRYGSIGDGANRCSVHLCCFINRCRLGQTDVGHLVGMGCTSDFRINSSILVP